MAAKHSAYRPAPRPEASLDHYYGHMQVHDRELNKIHSPDPKVLGVKPTAKRESNG